MQGITSNYTQKNQISDQQQKQPTNHFNEKMMRVKDALLNSADSQKDRDAQMSALFEFVIEAQKNELLKSCTATSITSVIRAAALNKLSLNSNSKEAYLIPRKNELTLLVGYQAYINRAYECGYQVTSKLLTKNMLNNFTYDPAEERLKQINQSDLASYLESTSFRREDIAAVCIRIYSKSLPPRDLLYSAADLAERAKQNIGYGKIGLGKVWCNSERQTDYGEMLKKTAVRHALKNIPNNKSINELLQHDVNSVAEMENGSEARKTHPPANTSKKANSGDSSWAEYT